MKKRSLILVSAILVSSCVSKKDFAALQSEKTKTQAELSIVKGNLQKCLIEQDEKLFALTEQIKYLQADKKNALKQVENLTVLTQSSSDNIKTVIAQLSAKDKYINGVREAMTQKDSLNLAIKYHLTRNLTGIYLL
jgi:chemotaxis protein MotB